MFDIIITADLFISRSKIDLFVREINKIVFGVKLYKFNNSQKNIWFVQKRLISKYLYDRPYYIYV